MMSIGNQHLYLLLPVNGEPEEGIREKMIIKSRYYNVCLLNGDDSGVYWHIAEFEDGTIVVMTDDGDYYHVTKNKRSGWAEKMLLGKVGNEADKALMVQTVRDIEVKMTEERLKEAAKAKRKAEKERKQYLMTLLNCEPFTNGKKWGLKKNGKIVVPPIYRHVHTPVGEYRAVETYPGIWGVIALDGKVEIEPKYEKVEIRLDGMVELTVFNGKTVIKNLKD